MIYRIFTSHLAFFYSFSNSVSTNDRAEKEILQRKIIILIHYEQNMLVTFGIWDSVCHPGHSILTIIKYEKRKVMLEKFEFF